VNEASFVRLVGDRVVIRRFQPDDAAPLSAYRSKPEVSRYQTWSEFGTEEASNLITEMGQAEPAAGQWYQLAIEAHGQLIGDLGYLLDQREHATARIGYSLDPAHQGQGLATEAVVLFLDWAFAAHRLHRVIASVDPRNVRSTGLLQRLRFRLEAHHVEAIWFKGEWADDLVYAMLDHEWRALRERS
jgi:RimJ/RimL family protein N-acetyltransferase